MASIAVQLTAATGALTQGFKQAEGQAQGFKDRLNQIGQTTAQAFRPIGIALAATTAALGAIVKSTANAGDQFAKMSAKLGVSTEVLSAFGHAADLAGVSMEQVQVALGRMARGMSDAQNGLATAKRSFDDLGITVQNTDGSLRAIPEVLFELADRFSGMTDATKKAALAQEILGRSGIELIPLLNQGSAAIRAQMEEAKRLGIVWSTDAAKAAEAFNDNLTRLGKALDGVKFAIGNALIPVLDDLASKLVIFVQTDKFRLWVQEIAQLSSSALPLALQLAGKAFQALSIPINAITVAILALATAFLEVERGILSAFRASMELLGVESLLGVTTQDLTAFTKDLEGWTQFYADTMGALSEQIAKATKDLLGFGDAANPLPAIITKTADAVKNLQQTVAPMSDELKRALKELTEGLVAAEKGLADIETRAGEQAEQSAIDTMRRASEMKSFWQQQLEAIQQSAATTWSSISLSFSSALAGMIQGTATFKEFLSSTFNTILQAIIQLVMQMMANWALATLFQSQQSGAQAGVHAATETAKTAVTAAQETARLGIVLAANKVMLGATIATLAAIGATGGAALAVMGTVVAATAAVLAAIAAALTASVVGAPFAPAFVAAAGLVAKIGGAAVIVGTAAIAAAIGTATAAASAALAAPLQHGGIVTQPIRPLIGEAGPEAVIPLRGSRGRAVLAELGGGGEIHLTVMLDERTLLAAIVPNIPGFVRIRAGIRTA